MKKDKISVFSNDNFYYKNQILHYQNIMNLSLFQNIKKTEIKLQMK